MENLNTAQSFPLPKVNLRSHLRALYIAARSGWRRYWRYPLNAASSILEPIAWFTPMFFLGQAFSTNGQTAGFAAYAGTGDFMSFVLLGSILNSYISSVFWGMGYALKVEMDSGVLESNWMSPLPRPLLLVGRSLHSILITTITSVASVLIAGLLFGFEIISSNLLPAIATVLPMLIGLYGFGFAFAALVLLMRDANTLVDVGSFLVQFFSGAQFPVTVLPRWLLAISMALPLTYGFDAMRYFLLGTFTLLPLRQEITLLIVFMVLMIAFGLWVLKKLDRHVRVKGTIGTH